VPRSLPTLKTFYYLSHFEEMLGFLEDNCDSLLGDSERDFILDFRSLSMESRALVVRLANRSGTAFRRSRLSYPEIPELGDTVRDLCEHGFARRPTDADKEVLFRALNRPEIVDLLKPRKRLSMMPKSALLELLLDDRQPTPLPDGLCEEFVVQERVTTLDFLFFLYFGKHRRNLKSLALRDLGIVTTRSGQSSFKLRFPTREAATGSFFYATLSERISDAEGTDLRSLAAEVADWPCVEDSMVAGARDREVCRLGARLEKADLSEDALQVYRHCTVHPARERICRLLYSSGDTEGAKSLLNELVFSPSSDEELLFAEDFRARKFGGHRVGRLTEMLRAAPTIQIDEAFRDGAENAAVIHYTNRGEFAYRTENSLWTALFGLMFWDLLQGEYGETTHNEFELRPTQLTDSTFFSVHESAIDQRLALLGTDAALPYMLTVIETHSGQPNGVFRWRADIEETITQLLTRGSPEAIATILRRIAIDPQNNSHGFPDLMVVAGGRLRFVEVKAEGDQIRRHQLVQLQAMEAAGFDVEIVRIRWFADPDQEYVVVDIETTGGRSPFHRITEIGAVKVHRGQVVDRYSTLVNPERSIPSKITRLTGISDSMVALAPKFAEVADKFRDFVGDAVFVAHSAKFDYGFIRQEFGRMEQDFRRPTLCTVVAMRKFFPGLPSYGLGSLTKHFDIPLDSHHRALCDAEATAALLKLINAKRT